MITLPLPLQAEQTGRERFVFVFLVFSEMLPLTLPVPSHAKQSTVS
jgi:hypothetical protein